MLACLANNKPRFDISGRAHIYTLMCYTYVCFGVEVGKYQGVLSLANSQPKCCLACASNTPCTTALLLARSYTPCKLARSLTVCAWTALRQLADPDNHLKHCQFPTFLRFTCRSGQSEGLPYGEKCLFVANDWHAALVPSFLAAKYRRNGVYTDARSIVAIHNMSHQGVEPSSFFGRLGLPSDW